MTTSETRERQHFQTERQDEISRLVTAEGRVEVAELAKRFNVTTETIRRDLSELDRRRILRRVHGGAVAQQQVQHEPLLMVRDTLNAREKQAIARRAVDELPGEGSILIDSGSTLAFFADLLPDDRNLTVFTNSIPVIQSLASLESIEVHVIGGQLKKETLAMVDAVGVETVEEIAVDVLFISTDRVTLEQGFTTPFREEAAIKRAMIAAARRVVMLFDHAKVGSDQLFRFADLSDVDTIITDSSVPEATARALEAHGPAVIRVG